MFDIFDQIWSDSFFKTWYQKVLKIIIYVVPNYCFICYHVPAQEVHVDQIAGFFDK